MGIIDQVKQAMALRKEAQKIQSEVERLSFRYENGGIACEARGDMTVTSITIADDVVKEVLSGKPDKFNTMLVNVINGALGGVKKKTQEMMQQMMMAQQGSGGGDGGSSSPLAGLGKLFK